MAEKTLHELNMEARKIDAALRETAEEAAEAASKAATAVLLGRRIERRVQKPLRPVAV